MTSLPRLTRALARRLACPLALLLAAPLFTAAAWAGPGHDHGDPAPAAVGTALPRFAAESELFELVGVLDGAQLTLYLDHHADNSPVRGAQIELEIGGVKFVAQPAGDDTYAVTLPAAPGAGVLPVVATVSAGDEIDLMAAELDLHDPDGHDDPHAHGWAEHAGWVAAGGGLLWLLGWLGGRLSGARATRAGGAA
jgi:hypothetical protein